MGDIIEIILREENGIDRRGEAVRCGVPCGRGELGRPEEWSLEDGEGAPVPFAQRPLAWWDDGSVKWLLVDFAADVDAGASTSYRLRRGGVSAPGASALRLVEDGPEGLCIDTGKMRLRAGLVNREEFRIRLEAAAGTWEVDPLGANLQAAQRIWDVSPEAVHCSLEHFSPQRAVVRLQADLMLPEGKRLGRVICRLHCLAAADHLMVDHTYINTADMRQCLLRDAGLLVRLPESGTSSGRALFGVDGETRAAEANAETCRLFQTNGERPRPLAFDQFSPEVYCGRGYASDGPSGERIGQRLDGWATWRQGEVQLTIAVADLWQQYPKEVVLGSTTAIKLFARDRLDGEELDIDWRVGICEEDISPTGAPWACYGEDGVAKTHRIWLCLHAAAEDEQRRREAEAFLAPLGAGVAPQHYAETGVLGTLEAANPERFPQTERFLQGLVEWIWRHQTAWSNWYGMLNWGDIQTHYLPVERRWTNLIERFGWINGEAEPQLSVLYQYVRTGDARWLRLGEVMVRHLVDVDTVHAGERKGNMRRHFAVHFGQPGDMSHTFLGAPCLHYFLTGDERVREVIEQVAETSMKFFARGYHRDSTDAMKNCLWYYELSRDKSYLEHAERILESVLSEIQEDGGMGVPHDTGFHTNCYLLSALLLYERLFGVDGAERIRQRVLRIADYEISPRGRSDDPSVSRGISYEILAFAYRQTGDPKYLYPGIKDLASLAFTTVYQTFTPTVRFPSGLVQHYRPWDGPVRPDSYTSVHWFGRYLTMVPHFLWALREADMDEAKLPIDAGVCGIEAPFARIAAPAPAGEELAWDAPGADYSGGDAKNLERGRFVPLDLTPLFNKAPLALDPFGYDGEAMRSPQTIEAAEHATMGAVEDNLRGLPWGTEAIFGGVPFDLAPCRGDGDLGLLLLEDGDSWKLEVGSQVSRLHFFGQTASRGPMQKGTVGAVYRIVFADGSTREVALESLVHYEDWRDLHYAPAASLACAWYPKAFSLMPAHAPGLVASDLDILRAQVERDESGRPRMKDDPNGLLPPIRVDQGPHAGAYCYMAYRVQRLRHLNQFAVDVGDQEVAAVEVQDSGAGHGLMLLAVTAEKPSAAARPTAVLSLADARVHGELPLDWRLDPPLDAHPQGASFNGDAVLYLQTTPGRYYISPTLAGGPLMAAVEANGELLTGGWHLLGHWCRDWPDPLQRIAAAIDAPDGRIELRIRVDPGLLYERVLNHVGGNGWTWDAATEAWSRRVPEPWYLVEVGIELIEEDAR